MNKREFVRTFAEKYDVSLDTAKELCTAVFSALKDELDKGEKVQIYNFGVFKSKTYKAKNVRHPKTGEIMTIPERTVITFKQSVSTKDEELEDEE